MRSNTLTAAATAETARPAGVLRLWGKRVLALGLAALGVFLALSWSSEPGSSVVFEQGALVAGGRLEATLYDPSLSGRDGGPVASNSFSDKAGRSCRRFADGPINGTACQIEGDWRVVEMRQR